MQELAARRDQALARLLAKLPERFATLRADLERSRSRGYRTWVHLAAPDPSPTFASVLAEKLRGQSARLRDRLAAIASASDNQRLSPARIEAKRLRYLLEPVARYVPEGKRAVRSLKGLQDVLGEMHDLEVLMQTLETGSRAHRAGARARAARRGARGRRAGARGRAPAQPRGRAARDRDAGARPPPQALRRARGRLARRARREVLRDRRGRRAAPSTRSGASRSRSSASSCSRACPTIAREAPSVRIEQGWMAGETIRERLRRVSDASGERFYRTIKLGTGLTRAEYEESISREMFEPLWPLTAGCRVEKRRYKLRDGELAWEIDVFEGRDLVTAEVELPSPDARARRCPSGSRPAWCAR